MSAVLLAPPLPRGAAVLLGHGAGGTLHTPILRSVAASLAACGHPCLRYNFPYADAGRRRPDFPRVLEATVRGAAGWLAAHTGLPLVLAGKSLGGRMASHVVADGTVEAAGLVFLGYPLHPPGKPDAMRDAHLPRIGCPMLFVEGTRDPFARSDLLTATIDRLREGHVRVELHVIEDGDHSFKVPAARRRPYEDVVAEVSRVVCGFVASAVPTRSRAAGRR